MLVLDQKSLKMISSFMKLIELIELNILVYELIDNERKPYKNMHVIYILTPCLDSIEKLINIDFPS